METATPELEFDYRVTEKDFVNAYLTHYKHSARFRAALYYGYPVLGIALVVLAVFMAVVQTQMGEEWNGPVPLFLLGCAWLACWIGRPWYLKRLYRKDPRFGSPIHLSIAGNRMNIVTATAEANYKHGTFIRALETDSVFCYTPHL